MSWEVSNPEHASIGDLTFENLLYEVERHVAVLTLNRPNQRNGISPGLARDLELAVERADADDSVKVVLLKGNGPSFCGGYDLSGLQSELGATADGDTADEDVEPGWSPQDQLLYSMRRDGAWWLKLFWNLRKPVIAQVQGACVAGGNDLIAAVDIVIASEDAQFGLPQARLLGLIHTMGLWPYYMGIRKVKELAFTGDTISGLEAERLGLINKAVPAEHLEEEARWLAERIALVPRQLLMAHKFAINRFVESAGLENAVRAAGEYDAIGSQNWGVEKFSDIARIEGIKAAITWRDDIWDTQAKKRPS